MRSLLITCSVLLSLILQGQTYSSKIFETDHLKFSVTADCRIQPFEGHYLKSQEGSPLLGEISFVLAGSDPAGNTYLAINAPYVDSASIYRPGFILRDAVFNEGATFLDEVFAVSGAEILLHIEDYEDNGIINNPNPRIFGWPAGGNRFFMNYYDGIDLTDEMDMFAHFHDRNGNGKYDPDQGDFPMYELGVLFEVDVLPEQLVWTSMFSPRYVSIGMTTYSLSCKESGSKEQTFFTQYDIVNSGVEDFDCMGQSTAVDLLDEHTLLSTTPTGDAYIVMDSDEENFGAYVQHHVLTGIVLDSDDRECDGFVDTTLIKTKFDGVIATYDSTQQGQQLNAESTVFEYRNTLSQGLWPDGTPITVGGSGYGQTSQELTYFLFQGDLRDTSDWNEYLLNETPAGKQSVYSTTYSLALQAGGASDKRTLAHTFLPSTSRDEVYDEITLLRSFFFDFIFNSERWMFEDLCTSTLQTTTAMTSTVTGYPNPTRGQFQISQTVPKATIFDSTGRELFSKENVSSLDLEELDKGIYFLVIEYADAIITEKVVKI